MLIAVVILNVSLFNQYDANNGPKQPLAANGMLDLSQWDIENDGIAKLDGKWSFYDGQLLEPSSHWDQTHKADYVPVPSSWNSYSSDKGVASGQGFATYRLTIRTEPDLGALAIRVPNIFSAYKLWINGRLLAEAGHVATDKKHSEAEQYPRIITFNADSGTADLIIQVSNYEHRKGGIWSGFTMGTSQQIARQEIIAVAEQMLIIGSLFIIGTYHLGLYAFRRRERFTLPFGLLCLLVALRMGVTGETMLFQRFPELPWEVGMRIEYIAFALTGVAGYAYIFRMFPMDGSKRFYRLAYGIGIGLSIATLGLPTIVFTRWLVVYQLFIITVCAYCFYVVVKARLRKREGSTLVLTGLSIFIATVINDILFYGEQLVSVQLVPIGVTCFILMQSLILSNRFTFALRKVELVSEELRELNMHLEKRVVERTDELQRSYASLEQSTGELERQEKSRRHLLSNISHDLRTPITLVQGYLEAMRDGVVDDKEQQRRYIQMMLGKLSRLNGLIDDLFELSKLEAGQVRFHYETVGLKDWLESLYLSFEMDVAKDGGILECRYNGELLAGDESMDEVVASEASPDHRAVRIDLARMEQVISNLIYNALRYLPDGEPDQRIYIDAYESGEVAIIEVRDTGSGIDPEDLPHIFDRFYKKDKSRNSSEGGSGLGLAIVKEIVQQHGGGIEARSEKNKGALFIIHLPIARS
ncbi:integral membrane sensor signal transduction histidine kinase [Paenibacillus curdlanolyticus YK9]|uniref:histidine kinase n=1 Tax=Paenibacillus curdlanolyticus YK9 TaxID=717606 RepID=E0I4X7_9BACL|nr:ATP-binding protein [Paenibacillus curdlanolyticus]EFM12019.1 integral membrane sensor signal transduction histidine kinase [Paenibacillus curdlanolyticus YK9]